jgi:putative pyruvate formate lyase activating enzyme
MDIMKLLEKCELCPRKCGVNRLKGETGYCRAGNQIKAARAMLHNWEEPCISGKKGSGTVFFSYCNMRCAFCQNHDISQDGNGKEISIDRLCCIFLELMNSGAENINLVSPTHYIPQIIEALTLAKCKGLNLPVVYNSNGYENTDTLKVIEGYIDVYLPDIKYYSDKYSVRYSSAPYYFAHASKAVTEMYRQVGPPSFKDGMIQRGIIVRHLLMPGLLSESKRILDFIASSFPKDIYLSLMSQYVPMHNACKYPEIDKRVSQKNYDWLVDYALSIGIDNGFIQEPDSAETIYTPEFNLLGI